MFQETITEFINFPPDLQPLKYLAAVRVAISVCESEDVQSMIGRFPKTDDYYGNVGLLDYHWERVSRKIRRKLNQIGVPDLIIGLVLANLWPVFFEIYTWIFYHDSNMGIVCPANFCWTPQVKIDYVKTAEYLSKNEELDIKKRFKLACIYCLDSAVRSLWDQMRLSERRFFFVRGNLKKCKHDPIVRYWTYYIQEVPIDYWGSKALNHTKLFVYAAEKGYLSATKFFLGKLKVQLRKRMISSCFYIRLDQRYNPACIVKDHLAIAFYLICQLPPDYYEIRYYTATGFVLLYFLEWPFRKHFMTVFNLLRHYFKSRIFVDVLLGIIAKEIGGFKDYSYKELFMEFWALCPEESKTYVNTTSRVGYKILMKFVKKHFGFVFEENAFAMKARFRTILFQEVVPENLTHFEKENVEFFKFLVRESVTTISSIDAFSQERYRLFLYSTEENEFFNLPLGELKYLIGGILGNV